MLLSLRFTCKLNVHKDGTVCHYNWRYNFISDCVLTRINLGWLKEPRFRNKAASNANNLKGATPTPKRDRIPEAATLQSPVKRGSQSARINAP